MILEKMKTGVSKIIMMILAGLLILSFAVWGVGDMTGAISGPGEVATVDDYKISQREFQEQFRNDLNRLRARIGDIDAEQARSLGLADSTLNGMISTRLLQVQANDLGLLISDKAVRSRIFQEPAFRNAAGQFDPSIFQTTLANNGLSEGAYVAQLRQEMQRDYLSAGIDLGVAVPPQLAETVYKYRNEKRTASVLRIPRPDIAQAPTPSDADLRTYLDENTDRFMAPEYRRLTVLYLNPTEVAKEMAPAPERIREEYTNRLPSLTVPERRTLEQILLKDEDAARKAYAALSEGRSFETVAEEFTEKTGDALKLGTVAKAELLPAIADAAFAAGKGNVTEPVKTPLGWHIIRVTDIQPGRQPALDEVRQQISDDIAHELALDDLVRQANRIEDALAGGASIEEAGSDTGNKVIRTEPIDAAKKLQAGTPVTGLPDDPRFIEIAFTTEKGESSRLTETADGGYFMVRVDDVIDAAPQPLDKVREAVTTAWKTEKLDEVAKQSAEKIVEEAKAGKALSAIADERKLVVETGKPVTRFDVTANGSVPRPLVPKLFEAKQGDYVMAETVDGYAVAHLTGIEGATPDESDPAYRQLEDTLKTALAGDLLQEYIRALREEYDVSVNATALDAFFANQQR